MVNYKKILTGIKSNRFFLIHFLTWTGYFASLWFRQFVYFPEGVAAGSISTWADGAAHLTYASSFAFRDTFPEFLPVYSGHPYTYSFVSDMLTGMLAKLGLNIFTSHSLLGFILSTIFIITLFKFYKSFLGKTNTAIIASWLFLLSGGMGFVWFFQDVFTKGFFEIIKNPSREYTHIGEIGLEWINTISSELLPQRSFLLGLPLGLFILIYLWNLYQNPLKIKKTQTFIVGIIMGLLPIIHPHTLITLFVTFVCLTPFIIFQNKKHAKNILLYLISAGLVASVIGLPLIFTFVLPATGGGFFRLYLGWLAKTKELNWFWFWVLNWGAFPFAAFFGMFLLSKKQRIFIIPFILLFIISNLFLFQPYDWDNSKIFTWVYLVLSAPVAVVVSTLFDKKIIGTILSISLFATLTFSGALDATRLLNPNLQPIPMYTNEELELASWVKTNTMADSLFLTSDRHNHPIPNLTGRQILMGYRGWLWTYGIDYGERQNQIRKIFRSPESSEVFINNLNIDYVVIGPSEIGDWQPNIDYYNQNTQIVYKSKNYTIYKLDFAKQ